MTDLDICIVTYLSGPYIRWCLDSIKKHSKVPNEIHQVDNFGNKRTLSQRWNELARRGTAPLICFLNPDTIVSPAWDAQLLAFMQRYPDVEMAWPTWRSGMTLAADEPIPFPFNRKKKC